MTSCPHTKIAVLSVPSRFPRRLSVCSSVAVAVTRAPGHCIAVCFWILFYFYFIFKWNMVSLGRSGWLKLRILLSQPPVLQSHLVSFLSSPVALPTAPVLSVVRIGQHGTCLPPVRRHLARAPCHCSLPTGSHVLPSLLLTALTSPEPSPRSQCSLTCWAFFPQHS